jgi:phosphoribosylanthranilate isomerase
MEYVKVCGLKQYDHVQLCIDNGASAVGFIYKVPSSPRNLTSIELKSILSKIRNEILTVVVFKPLNVPELVEVMNDIPATLFQIHIGFDIKELDKLSNYRKNKIILALSVNETNQQLVIDQINDLKNQFFAFLIDNSEGHGNELDLELVKDVLDKTPGARVIVAGGIKVENVKNIIDVLEPYGIDASSSLESDKGVKDPSKMKEFLKIIKKRFKNK